MHPSLARALDRLRQPEYTGDNRCTPCTIVNVVIAAVVAVGLVSPVIGLVAFGLSVGTIYVRGYLVPGTPTLTKRYLPDRVLAKFDKAPEYGVEPAVDGEGLEVDAEAGVDDADEASVLDPEMRLTPEKALLSANVIEPCAEEDDLCLVTDARDAWRDRMTDLQDGSRRHQVARLLQTDAETVAVETGDPTDHVVVRVEGRIAARWESEPALIADLAATSVLEDRLDGWAELPIDQQSQLAGGMRAFLESCPDCDAPISIDTETVESCCRSYEVYAITCEACEARLLEVDA